MKAARWRRSVTEQLVLCEIPHISLVDRPRHLVPPVSLGTDSNSGQVATIGWESSEPVAPLDYSRCGGFFRSQRMLRDINCQRVGMRECRRTLVRVMCAGVMLLAFP
jgi:hypothetical protein